MNDSSRFANVSTELEEIQSPIHGRKFATLDRRPIDPPPIVRAKFVQSRPDTDLTTLPSTSEVTDYPYNGLICIAELLRVSPPSEGESITPSLTHSRDEDSQHLADEDISLAGTTTDTETVLPFISDHPPPSAAHMDAVIAATPALDPDLASQDTQSPQSPPSTELTLHEETATDKLFGTAQVQARVATWQNEKMTLFVFGDLAVKGEGQFRLRYKLFDILSGGMNAPHPVMATLDGATFTVWSSRNFPGLENSTELTKHVALQGAAVHVRWGDGSRERRDKT